MMQDIKVYLAGAVGLGAPGANLFLEAADPWLKALVLVGQITVAVVTTLYIYAKWKNRK